jgi:predicted outer membrane repeat protein
MGFHTKRDSRSFKRPAVEVLEGRVVLTTFHVNNVADLQADVAAASNSPVPNTIVVDPGFYNLTAPLQIQNATNLTIVGKNARAGSTTLVAPNANRVFEIDGGNVTLAGLTVAGGGGVDRGGGILAQNANLTLKNVSVSGNTAAQQGGGIYASGGVLNVESSSVVSNGAINAANPTGGGIATLNTTVSITNSTINQNTAVSYTLDPNAAASATAAGIYAQGGTVTIKGSQLAHNSVYAATTGPSATALGGAGATKDAAVVVDGSTVTGNGLTALSAGANTMRGSAFSTNGGTLTVSGSKFLGNLPGGTSQFDHPGATVVLKNTTVDGQKQIGRRTLKA